ARASHVLRHSPRRSGAGAADSRDRPHRWPLRRAPGVADKPPKSRSSPAARRRPRRQSMFRRFRSGAPWLLEANRQTHPERRAAALLTLHRDAPTVAVQDVPGTGQADAGATDPLLNVARALKPLEDAPLIAVWDANAMVNHIDGRPVA